MTSPPSPPPIPARGQVWIADLDPTQGHEQAGRRPVLILSVNQFNRNPAELCVALPITGTLRRVPIHIPVLAPEGGLTKDSVVLCDQLRTLDRHRLLQGLGMITPATLTRVEACVRAVLGL